MLGGKQPDGVVGICGSSERPRGPGVPAVVESAHRNPELCGVGGQHSPVTAAVVQRQTASTYSGMRSDALGQSVRAAVYMLCIADGTEPAN